MFFVSSVVAQSSILDRLHPLGSILFLHHCLPPALLDPNIAALFGDSYNWAPALLLALELTQWSMSAFPISHPPLDRCNCWWSLCNLSACFGSFVRVYHRAMGNLTVRTVVSAEMTKWIKLDWFFNRSVSEFKRINIEINSARIKKIQKSFHTSFTSGVVLRRSSSSRGSIPLRNETVRRRSCFGFDNGIGFTPPLLFALVLLLLLCFPVDQKQIKYYSIVWNLAKFIWIFHLTLFYLLNFL